MHTSRDLLEMWRWSGNFFQSPHTVFFEIRQSFILKVSKYGSPERLRTYKTTDKHNGFEGSCMMITWNIIAIGSGLSSVSAATLQATGKSDKWKDHEDILPVGWP
jgi:hypothetical protein